MYKLKLALALAFICLNVMFYIDYDKHQQEYNTVQVVVEDVMTKPAAIYEGQYIPESYYLVIGYNNQCTWSIRSKEAYDQYKDRVGDIIDADVRIGTSGYNYLSKLEGQSISGIPDNAVFRSYPVGLVYYRGQDK